MTARCCLSVWNISWSTLYALAHACARCRLRIPLLSAVSTYWCIDLLTQKKAYCVKQMMPNVQPPPALLSAAVTASHLREVLILGEKVDSISGFHALTQLTRSCKTGCSIVNFLKSQTQHIFSPCSPCDELTDPQTCRPLSADRKTSCLLRVQGTAHHPDDRRKKYISALFFLLSYQVTCCTNASKL